MEKKVIVRDNGTKRVIHMPVGESKTRKEMAKATDVNNIMNRYKTTGQLTHVTKNMPWYGDATAITDYQGALNSVLAAQEKFAELPSKLRERFRNDPGALIAFLQDPANKDEAIKLGLVAAPPRVEKGPEVPAPGSESKPS